MAAKTFIIKKEHTADFVSHSISQLNGFNSKFILFFASGEYVDRDIGAELSDAFPACTVIGCTSHSEYCNNSFEYHSIAIMALDSDTIEDLHIDVIENVSNGAPIKNRLDSIHNYFGGYDNILKNFDKYVGIVLFDTVSKVEEPFMDMLGMSTDILYIGGTNSATEKNISKVYAFGKSFSDAVILATFKTVKGYDILKTQSAQIFSEKPITVTKLDLKNRIAYEFDNRPVAEVYAEHLGVDVKSVADYFVSNPLGVVADEEIFIRTFNEVLPDGSISLHCGIPEGTQIHVLKIGNIIEDTRKALDDIIKEPPAAVININCLYRTLTITQENVIPQYCELWGRYTSIGFSSFGEAYLGHINETSTVLILK